MIRADAAMTQKMMSSRLGLGQNSWQRLEAGLNAPSGETLLAISELGYDPTWVLTGSGTMRREPSNAPTLDQSDSAGIDEELFARITDAIVRLYKDEQVSISPMDLGRLSARKYAEITSATGASEERRLMVKLIAAQLRAALQAAAAEPGTGKRSA